jgi:anti-anti-sigma factor
MNKTLIITVSPLNKEKRFQIVDFNGDFDKAGFTDIREQLNGAVKSFVGSKLVFDFTKLKFINSEGIGYLMEVHAHLVKDSKQLIIVGANSHVKDVFGTIGLSEIITLYPSLDAFLKA